MDLNSKRTKQDEAWYPSADELRRACRREPDPRVRLRMIMVAHALDGESCETSGRAVGMRRQTARLWIRRFRERGVDGLRDLPRSGRPPKVDPATAKALEARVQELGDSAEIHSASGIRRMLKNEFGIECSLAATYKLMRQLSL